MVEGQTPRGIYLLCKGRVKLSVVSSDGKTLIMRIAEPGEVLGLSAAVLAQPYEFSAETLEPVQVNFIKRDDFLRFLRQNGDACLRVAEQLSKEYQAACREISSLGLSHSAARKLANLLLNWNTGGMGGHTANEASTNSSKIKLTLTQEEIAQMIGTSRETVTRLLAKFRDRGLIELRGSTLTILNRAALDAVRSNTRVEEEPVLPRRTNVTAMPPRPRLAQLAAR